MIKLVESPLGLFNGYINISVGDYTLAFEYVTPQFNDYDEWRNEGFKIFEEVIVEDIQIGINIPFETINEEVLLSEIKRTIESQKTEGLTKFEYGLDLKENYYRQPTDEEMTSNNSTLDDYSVGQFITKNDEDLIPINDFQPENEFEKLSYLILKDIRNYSSLIYESGTRSILL